MAMRFTKAEKKKSKLRLALAGPTGSGKTYTALVFAARIAERIGSQVALIDTESGSASLYADRFDFDVLELEPPYTPARYVEALNAAAAAGYGMVVVDSLSHAWSGPGGALEMVDDAARRMKGNKYMAWGDVTPEHHRLIEAMIRYPGHLVGTMRSKMEYVQEEEGGKKSVRKVGMAPVQRDGMEYEFTLVADMDVDHFMAVGKTRCSDVDGVVVQNPGPEFADTLLDWLESGRAPADRWAETVKDVAPEAVAAFARTHPKLPDDPASWGEPELELALSVVAQRGPDVFTGALAYMKAQESQAASDAAVEGANASEVAA